MSSDRGYLSLKLEGPLQSWGFDSQYNRRNTGLMPTKSGIAGMCCAALGFSRGSSSERDFLAVFGTFRMLALALPRNRQGTEIPVRRLQDYHTVQNTRRANGSINRDCVLTYRQYLVDASFGVLLEGDFTQMEMIATALADPKWGIWLGRKACVPTAPVLAGFRGDIADIRHLVKKDRDESLQLLIGDNPLISFTRQEEVEDFTEGQDSLPDQAISFASDRRLFSPRRIRSAYAAIGPSHRVR